MSKNILQNLSYYYYYYYYRIAEAIEVPQCFPILYQYTDFIDLFFFRLQKKKKILKSDTQFQIYTTDVKKRTLPLWDHGSWLCQQSSGSERLYRILCDSEIIATGQMG